MDIQINQVVKTYTGQKQPAVHELSLGVQQGAIMALVGESGSGKTTLLRLIAGLEQPDQGEISINGEVVASGRLFVPPNKRKVGLVFQDFALFPHLDLLGNVGYALKGLTKGEKIVRVQELLELTGLKESIYKYPGQLSGGQQQRVALARALAANPKVLLLDEPFSSLDAVLREQVREEVRSIIKRTGITVLLVTHDTKDALATADQIAVMAEGRLLQAGSVEEIYWRPSQSYVAELFGKFNRVEASWDTDKKAWHTAFGVLCLPAHHDNHFPQRHELLFRPSQVELEHLASDRHTGIGIIQNTYYAGDHWEIRVAAPHDPNRVIWVHSRQKPEPIGSELRFQLIDLCNPIKPI